MKSYNFSKIILISSLFCLSLQIRPSLLPMTPKAMDLTDHYGTEPVLNIYGPHHRRYDNLAREGVSPGTAIKPITNFAKEIDPTKVTGGDLTNTAYDSSKIIKPEYAQPKLDITSKIVHDAVVKTPVQLGEQIQEKTVQTQNRITGEVDTKTVETKTPIVGVMSNLRKVETEHRTFLNMNDGKAVNLTKEIGFFGLE